MLILIAWMSSNVEILMHFHSSSGGVIILLAVHLNSWPKCWSWGPLLANAGCGNLPARCLVENVAFPVETSSTQQSVPCPSLCHSVGHGLFSRKVFKAFG